MNAITKYINEAITELHQVRWPTRQQAVRLSIIVIGFTAVVSVAFGALDYVLAKVVNIMLSFI